MISMNTSTVPVTAKASPKKGMPGVVVAKISQLMSTPKRIYGTPAASLTWGIAGSATGDVTAGSEGEKQTAKILEAFAAKHADVRVFHSVRWPGSKGDTDHMVVIGNHVIIIDSKRWMSSRKYSVTAKGTILRGTVPFPEGKVKMIPSLKAWREKLPTGVKLTGVISISQEKVFVPYDRNWYKAPFKLVTAENLEEYLTKYKEKQKADTIGYIDINIIEPIITNLIKARDRRSEIINLAAMKR